MRMTKYEVLRSIKNAKLRPCPFCGRIPTIIFTDDEGNYHEEDYLDSQWSGLMFAISHEHVGDFKCPVANHKGETIGSWQYYTVDELATFWNRRHITSTKEKEYVNKM
jgi:hypothetical protein